MKFSDSEFHLNSRLGSSAPVHAIPNWERIEMTSSCHDSDSIPKVEGAGGIFKDACGRTYQRMHNGVRVVAGGYHGDWMSEVIRRLQGHHEPQEELLFDYAMRSLRLSSNPVMIELGSFWAYYSLWFKKQFPMGRAILVEPDPNSLKVGEENFELNGQSGEFYRRAIGGSITEQQFEAESDGRSYSTPGTTIDVLVEELQIDRVHVLHCDVQGAEFGVLKGAVNSITNQKIDWIFISTHHHSISNDPLTHQRCLQWLLDHEVQILSEHSVSESYSGDGLIVGHGGGTPPSLAPPVISRNIPSRSLFRELEFDLDQAWREIERLRQERRSGGSGE